MALTEHHIPIELKTAQAMEGVYLMRWLPVGLGVATVFWGFIANDQEGSERSRWLIIGGLVMIVLAVVGMDFVG